MKHKLKYAALISLSFMLNAQRSPFTITFFVRPIPISLTDEQKKSIEKFKDAVKSLPQSKFKTTVKKEFNPESAFSGIYATYAGISAHSNNTGQITFERVTPETRLNVLVSEDIKPVPIKPDNPKTIYGFTLEPKAQAVQYLFERMQDPETELYSWQVQKVPLKKSGRIPFDTIILFANPKELIVPLGSFPSIAGENLFLPDLFVTPDYHSVDPVFRVLKLRQYFAPVRFEYQFFPEEYQQKVSS